MTDTPAKPSGPRGAGADVSRMLQRRHGARRTVVLTVLCVALVACSDVASRSNGLTVEVTGLPSGVDAAVTVEGDDDAIAVASSGLLENVETGSYLVRAAPVVAADVQFAATPAEQRVRVSDDRHATARVRYAPSVDGASVGDEASGAVLGMAASGNTSLHGVAWIDRDGDGRFGRGDTVLDDATVFIDLDQDGTRDEGEPVARTDRAGQYRFGDLAPGTPLVLGHEAGPETGREAARVVRSDADDERATAIRHHAWQSVDGRGGDRSAR